MAGLAAEARHLWLNLTEIRKRDKNFLLNALISQSGLFGNMVSTVVEKFCTAKRQSAAFKQLIPQRA